MSKLSPALKNLISAPFARPNVLPAPREISSVYERISREAAGHDVGTEAWLSLATAATMTMNSPDSLSQLYRTVLATNVSWSPVRTAEFMREVGLKCISFNGIPRTINMLGAFRSSLPPEVVKQLRTTTTRETTPTNLPATHSRGQALWTSIYTPHATKLLSKLSASHPDLPVHILESHYSHLLSNPPTQAPNASSSSPPASSADGSSAIATENHPNVGRILTSLVAIACLRAQTGVGPQVTSHVFGLRKAFSPPSPSAPSSIPFSTTPTSSAARTSTQTETQRQTAIEAEDAPTDLGLEDISGARWLASDEGSVWALEVVDLVVEGVGGGAAGREHEGTGVGEREQEASVGGSSFAPGYGRERERERAKL